MKKKINKIRLVLLYPTMCDLFKRIFFFYTDIDHFLK